MADALEPLILDLLESLAPGERPYSEFMEAWRTSCPGLPVWEEATGRGLVARRHEPGRSARVALTDEGREHLRKHRGAQRPSS